MHSHINNKSECPYCNISTNKLNKDFFIEKAKKLYGEKYSYSEVEYINSKTKVKIYFGKTQMIIYLIMAIVV